MTPVEFEFCHDPPTMNALELDIVKLIEQLKVLGTESNFDGNVYLDTIACL